MLPDVLRPGLRLVFCGTAAGTKSAELGAYYAGPGNQFWPVLHRIGLTPTRLVPSEYSRLVNYGVGLTDVCKTRSGSDLEVGEDGFDVDGFVDRLRRVGPDYVAFNGKKAAQTVLGRPVGYGAQPEQLADARVFVLPSTSGAARGFWGESHWRDLAAVTQ
jgi:TDG/mug DNA glycosylase family protein